jgi:UDP-N-acetylmuramate dehydrogenase
MEKAGLRKGHTSGNVGLSTCHVLALVNRGGGTAAEILSLVDHVKQTVHARFGIDLHPEPVFIGFDQQSGNNSILKAGEQT